MEPKNFNKKLTLNKNTISNLRNSEMDNIYAGNENPTQNFVCTLRRTQGPCILTKDPTIDVHICCL